MKGKARLQIIGIPIDIFDMSYALEYIDHLIQNGKKGNYILAVNPEKIITLHKIPSLKNLFENSSLLVPDGIGIVLAIRWLYGLKISRVPGIDLMQNICKDAARKGYKIFIFGAKEEVNKIVVKRLNFKYPGIQIVGRCNGFIGEDRMNDLINKINKSKADILFVALGSPKQERWIQKYLPKLNIEICQGVGGALNTIAGKPKRAPDFIQRIGLEWLYRMVVEPKRIRRQIVLPVFVLKVLKEKLASYKK